MDRENIKLLKEELNDIEDLNIEQKLLMFKYFIRAYIRSLLIFGYQHEITKECLFIWNSVKNVIKEEGRIHKFIRKNGSKITLGECTEILDSLMEINDKTILYYSEALDDIEAACDTKCEARAKHYKRNFKTLIETDNYRMQVAALVINFEDIKIFLNYEEDFWNYISSKIIQIDSIEKMNFQYETIMHFDENNNLDDMRVIVPYIINLKTALINIHEFKHAYDLYKLLGMPVDENNPYHEESASLKEDEFAKTYVLKKFDVY